MLLCTKRILRPRPSRQIKAPSLSLAGRPVFFQAPKQLRLATEPNLDKALAELFGGELTQDLVITDSSLPFSLNLRVTLV